MKDVFVDQLKTDTGSFDGFFQVTQVDRKDTKAGKPYLTMKLRDKTGEVGAKLWDIPEGFTTQPGDFLKVRAETGKDYRDPKVVELKLKLVKVLDRAEVDIADFIPASKRDRNAMYNELGSIILSIGDPGLQLAVSDIVAAHSKELRDAPAARKMHQAYLGGLLEHVLNMCALVDGICKVYPDLDRDVMVAGVIVHDIGKLWEMAYEDHIGTTRPGNLLGHIIQGSVFWANNTEMLDPVTRDHVAHIIVSHHGCKEWGSPILPMTREAQLVHLVDMIDSKVAIMDGALAGPLDPDGFTSRIHALDTALWNGAPDAAA